MAFLQSRIPPVLVLAVCAVLMLLGALPKLEMPSPGRLTLVFSTLLLGCVISLAGVLSFRRARTTVNPLVPQEASTLVDGGIYRYSRNPMYLGFAIVLLAWALALGEVLPFLGIIGFVLYIQRFQITPEERALQQRFGESFSSYKGRVRRWI